MNDSGGVRRLLRLADITLQLLNGKDFSPETVVSLKEQLLTIRESALELRVELADVVAERDELRRQLRKRKHDLQRLVAVEVTEGQYVYKVRDDLMQDGERNVRFCPACCDRGRVARLLVVEYGPRVDVVECSDCHAKMQMPHGRTSTRRSRRTISRGIE